MYVCIYTNYSVRLLACLCLSDVCCFMLLSSPLTELASYYHYKLDSNYFINSFNLEVGRKLIKLA